MTRRISAIEPQKKSPGRVNVYLDGEFAFGLARILAVWLNVGLELDEKKIAELQAEDQHEEAYQKALHFLSYRPRSSDEVRRNLTQRGLSEELVGDTLQRLQQAGLVNDAEFARSWIENRDTFRPRSQLALRTELRRKGLADEVIESALRDHVNEEVLALDAARKYAARLAGLAWPDFRRKLGAFLARRGFSYDTIAPVVSKVWKESSRTADGGETLDDKDRL
ncbi:MAG: RecX family transcriptional regulator [Anaerolineales bacterium]|jgi:regulatory protein